MATTPIAQNIVTGDRINKARRMMGLNGEDLGNAFAVTAQTISNWENGKVGVDVETIADLANVLHVSIAYLMGLEDSPREWVLGLTRNQRLRVSRAMRDSGYYAPDETKIIRHMAAIIEGE